MTLSLRPVSLAEAKRFVGEHHRHNRPDVGWKWGVGLDLDGDLVAVGTAGRPKGRGCDDGWTLEITRCCTVGTPNAASMIYGALNRAAKALGYRSTITYTLTTEPGSSLLAAGFHVEAELGERPEWQRSDDSIRVQTDLFGNETRPAGPKYRWRRWLVPAALLTEPSRGTP